MPKYFILNAKNFGISKESNRAVLDGYNNGFLTSAAICVNGKACESALNEILPECPNLSIGVNLNLTIGSALTKNEYLTDKHNHFSNNYFKIRFKSYDKEFMNEVEKEFRCQIETVLQYSKIDFLDSVHNVHLIGNIFSLVTKLAKEYDIKFVNTKFEEPYYVPNFFKHLNFRYIPNLVKTILFNYLSRRNLGKLTVYTNNYYIGNMYNSMLDKDSIKCGLEAIDDKDNYIVEAGIFPCVYKNSHKKRGVKEFLLTLDKELLDSIERMGFEVTNYKKLK